MTPPGTRLVHGTAILLGDLGILLRGPARSGKSSLAFLALRRAEAAGLPARLVADDQVILRIEAGGIAMAAPGSIAGFIEVSGVGILREAGAGGAAPLALLADLLDDPAPERLPDPAAEAAHLLGRRLPRIVLPAREAALGAEILVHLARTGLPVPPGGPAGEGIEPS